MRRCRLRRLLLGLGCGLGRAGSVLDAVVSLALLLLLEEDAPVDELLVLLLLALLVGLLLLKETLVLLVLQCCLLLLSGCLGRGLRSWSGCRAC